MFDASACERFTSPSGPGISVTPKSTLEPAMVTDTPPLPLIGSKAPTEWNCQLPAHPIPIPVKETVDDAGGVKEEAMGPSVRCEHEKALMEKLIL